MNELGCFKCADFIGKNIRTMREQHKENDEVIHYDMLAASKDCLYFRAACEFQWDIENYIMKIPKNPPSDILVDVQPEVFIDHE